MGGEVLRRRAGGGDREAQWSLGWALMSNAGVPGTPLGAAGSSPQADVGLALCTSQFLVAHQNDTR